MGINELIRMLCNFINIVFLIGVLNVVFMKLPKEIESVMAKLLEIEKDLKSLIGR